MKNKRNFVFKKDSDFLYMRTRNYACQLLLHGHIKIVRQQALAVQKYVDRVITIAKKQNLAATRELKKLLLNIQVKPQQSLVYHVMHNIAVKYKNRNGGFCTKNILGPRKGDNSIIVLLKLI